VAAFLPLGLSSASKGARICHEQEREARLTTNTPTCDSDGTGTQMRMNTPFRPPVM